MNCQELKKKGGEGKNRAEAEGKGEGKQGLDIIDFNPVHDPNDLKEGNFRKHFWKKANCWSLCQ